MTIDQVIEKLESLHAASTQGEWSATDVVDVDQAIHDVQIAEHEDGRLICTLDEECDQKSNQAFLVAAHNHMPALLAEVRRLQYESKEWQQQAATSGEVIHRLSGRINNSGVACLSGHDLTMHIACGYCFDAADKENTALKQQLAESEKWTKLQKT